MELHWHHPEVFEESDRRLAKARIRDLARDHADLMDVRIAARAVARDASAGQEVRITGATRDCEIVASRLRSDPGVALDATLDAFECAIRRRHRQPDGPGTR